MAARLSNDSYTVVINADNGPENSGVRTQWLKRLMEFSAHHGVTVQLAGCSSYHSKRNPSGSQAMKIVEKGLERMEGLEKWFVMTPTTQRA